MRLFSQHEFIRVMFDGVLTFQPVGYRRVKIACYVLLACFVQRFFNGATWLPSLALRARRRSTTLSEDWERRSCR